MAADRCMTASYAHVAFNLCEAAPVGCVPMGAYWCSLVFLFLDIHFLVSEVLGIHSRLCCAGITNGSPGTLLASQQRPNPLLFTCDTRLTGGYGKCSCVAMLSVALQCVRPMCCQPTRPTYPRMLRRTMQDAVPHPAYKCNQPCDKGLHHRLGTKHMFRCPLPAVQDVGDLHCMGPVPKGVCVADPDGCAVHASLPLSRWPRALPPTGLGAGWYIIPSVDSTGVRLLDFLHSAYLTA